MESRQSKTLALFICSGIYLFPFLLVTYFCLTCIIVLKLITHHPRIDQIQPVRSDPLPWSCRNRKEESVLTRLHIGHTYTTSRHLLAGEAEPICIGCDEPLTVEHILVKCWDFYEIRRKHYSVENVKVFAQDVPPERSLISWKK